MPGPGPSAHQVLVYSGPGVSPLALSHSVLTLSLLLAPNYTVQPIDQHGLNNEPWEPATALLVIPGGRDMPFVQELSQKTKVTNRIQEYVAMGGRYFGICAGAYFGCKEVRFDIGGGKEVSGERELAFFPGACAGPVYRGFDYGSERGAQAVDIILEWNKRHLQYLYYNGGGHFVLPSPLPKEVQVVARYAKPSTPGEDVAAVLVDKGKGKALLASVHLEYPLGQKPALDAIAGRESVQPGEVEAAEKARIVWAGELLVELGLTLPSQTQVEGVPKIPGSRDPDVILNPTHPSPIFVLSHPSLPQLAASALASPTVQSKIKPDGRWGLIRDGNDELAVGSTDIVGDVPSHMAQWRATKPDFPPRMSGLSLDDDSGTATPQPPDFHSLKKEVLVPGSRSYDPSWTPLFNFNTYWTELDAARARDGRKSGVLRKDEHGNPVITCGDSLLYAETVTSTQTMLDRNPILLAGLPTPTTFLATYQLNGRGRGSNKWLSPAGCLQFSILVTLPKSMSNKMLLIQYLMALAVCEAVDADGRLGVRIKWPNDIYAEVEGVGGTKVGSGQKGRVKLGGILVNTNYINGEYRIIIGCGINVLNALPTSSLSQLHALLTTRETVTSSKRPLPVAPTMENTFARIMHAFATKWEGFVESGGFEDFMAEYHARWLHSNQEVTLTTTTPPSKLRIVGITPDQGLLRCIPTESASYQRGQDSFEDRVSSIPSSGHRPVEYVDLQPDGNSFDLMSGMIRRKA